MIIMEEKEFYDRFLDIKKENGLKWSAFGGILQMSDAAIRMAFKKKSLKPYEREKIEKSFDSTGNAYSVSGNDLLIKKDGVEVTIDDIAIFASHNEEEFFKHKYFSNYIDLRVTKKLNLLLRDKDELKKFLNS